MMRAPQPMPEGIERPAAPPGPPPRPAHLANCEVAERLSENCTCGAGSTRTEREARADARKAKRASPNAPEYWIVTDYGFFEHPTLAAAEAERDKLFRRFPGKQFRVLRCKRRLRASNTRAILAAHEKASAFVARLAAYPLNGEEGEAESIESIVLKARELAGKIGSAG